MGVRRGTRIIHGVRRLNGSHSTSRSCQRSRRGDADPELAVADGGPAGFIVQVVCFGLRIAVGVEGRLEAVLQFPQLAEGAFTLSIDHYRLHEKKRASGVDGPFRIWHTPFHFSAPVVELADT